MTLEEFRRLTTSLREAFARGLMTREKYCEAARILTHEYNVGVAQRIQRGGE